MTTMTREEALTIVTSIVREHSRECREPKPCQDCELEAEAIAALSQPEPGKVSRERMVIAADAMEYERVCGRSPCDALMAALHQLGAKVEVSDG